MRKLKWLVVGLMAAMLVGCGKTPPDSLTEKVIRAGAEQTMLQGMEIGDFKRDNGWVENNAANLYTVKYTFNYVLKMPYGEATLENAKEIEHAYSDLDKKGDSAMFIKDIAGAAFEDIASAIAIRVVAQKQQQIASSK